MAKTVNTTHFANRKIFIVLNVNDAKGFAMQHDRDYFSKPVEVVLDRTCLIANQLYVTDPNRGHTYPVHVDKIKTIFHLTQKQLAKATFIAK